METPTVNFDWYRPGPSIKQFHQSPAFVRALIGARGSGKTCGTSVEAIRHGLHNPGARILGLRKTEISQGETTTETFKDSFDQLGDLFVPRSQSLFREWRDYLTVRFPSLEAIDRFNHFMQGNPNKAAIDFWLVGEANKWCSWLFFRGLPDTAKSANRLRGYECSLAVLIEADLLDRSDYDLTVACLRWKNAHGKFIEDTGIIIDSNPPGTRHWLAQMEEETTKDKDDKFKFWHIPTRENAHNLPPNYVENLVSTYKKNPAMHARMVEGQYADAFDGAPVFHAFDQGHAYEDLPWPRGAYLVRGWDFGVVNACVFSAYWKHEEQEYWWDLKELFLEDSDTDRQCRRVVEITTQDFSFWNDRDLCSGVLDYCDPAGAARKDTGKSTDILATYGIYPSFKNRVRSLQKSIAVYNRILEAKDKQGNFIYRIDKKGCPLLYVASIGGYRYPKVGEAGYGNDEPGKGPSFGNFDHVADAARYPKINCMNLAKMDNEKPIALGGPLGRKLSLNPLKRWR